MFKTYAGPRSKNLSQDHVIKPKAVYTLVEQLYIGAQRALAAISPANQGPNRLSDVLKKLSILPARFQEVKRSCARAGALTALIRSKAWLPDLDPADVARRYPTVKEDGSLFEQDDFVACGGRCDLRPPFLEMKQISINTSRVLTWTIRRWRLHPTK